MWKSVSRPGRFLISRVTGCQDKEKRCCNPCPGLWNKKARDISYDWRCSGQLLSRATFFRSCPAWRCCCLLTISYVATAIFFHNPFFSFSSLFLNTYMLNATSYVSWFPVKKCIQMVLEVNNLVFWNSIHSLSIGLRVSGDLLFSFFH